MDEQNKWKVERDVGSRNYANISSLKDSKDSGVINNMEE